jgi:Glycosyltransferase family 87
MQAAGTLVHRYGTLWPVINWGLFGLGTAFVIAALTGAIDYGIPFGDGAAWYYVDTPYDWSDRPPSVAEYRYSPAFLWITEPFRWLPFELYVAVWTALHLAAVAWLAPWMMAFPGVADDTILGNINTFLALGVVLAVRGQAWTWAGVLLTKVTPGVGILFHAGRRDWRAVGIAFGLTAAIVTAGYLIDPALWQQWFSTLATGGDTYASVNAVAPLPVRLVLGAALCVAAVRRTWLLPIGMIVAMPGLWPSSFALLAAIPRLLRPSST